MSRPLARRLIVALVFAAAASGRAAAQDPPPAPPAPPLEKPAPPSRPPAPPKPKAPTYVGIQFERDFAEGMRRSVAQGRPVYVCVNAQDVRERGNVILMKGTYPTAEMGEATREWVCVVANDTTHESKTVDGDEVCGLYLCGTCQAHLDALQFVLKRFGDSFISPSHAVVDPDGAVAYHGDFMQSALSTADLDRWFIRLSPRLAVRRAWSVRAEKTDALGKTKTEELEAAAKAWIDSKDVWAAPALVAMADQEGDENRKAGLIKALAGAGTDAAPVLFDSVDAASSESGSSISALWTTAALACDRALGAFALGRATFHQRDPIAEVAPNAASTTGPSSMCSTYEALVLRGRADALPAFEKAAAEASLPADRIERAKAKAGRRTPPKLDALDSMSRDDRRRAWMAATPDEVKAAKAKALEDLKHPLDEIRVAAAIALRRAGDASGAKILLDALGDPVEQPDVRAALIEIVGEDRGESPEAWADVIRGGGK